MSKPGKVLKGLCKKLGVRLTIKRGKKRVYKSVKVLKAQCANKKKVKKKKKKVKRRRRFGPALSPKDKRKIFDKLEEEEKKSFYRLSLLYKAIIEDEKGNEKKLFGNGCKLLDSVIYKMEQINSDLVPGKAYDISNKYCSEIIGTL